MDMSIPKTTLQNFKEVKLRFRLESLCQLNELQEGDRIIQN